MRALVLADTHIRADGRRRLPDAVYALLGTVDAVLHAGDFVAAAVFHELGGFAPVYGVLGNNDDGELAGLLPEARVDELGGVRVGMIHDSGPTKGRAARMRRRFPGCDLVVFGHSHVPLDEPGLDGQRLFNPGSAIERRSQPRHTVGLLELEAGRLRSHRLVALD